jgi:hypothetical protein
MPEPPLALWEKVIRSCVTMVYIFARLLFPLGLYILAQMLP